MGDLYGSSRGCPFLNFDFLPKISFLPPRGRFEPPGGVQNRSKTAFSGRFRLFSAPKTEGEGAGLRPKHFWQPPPVWGFGNAHSEPSEHRWGWSATPGSRFVPLFGFCRAAFLAAGVDFARFWDPENRSKWGFSLVKTAIFKKVRFLRLRRFCQRCPAVPPACGS